MLAATCVCWAFWPGWAAAAEPAAPAAPVATSKAEADAGPFDTAVLLATDPSVQSELELTADQRQRIQALIDKLGRQIWVLRDWPLDKSRERLEPPIRQLETGVRQILNRPQRQRLTQLMLQQRGPEGLLWPEIAEVLGITPHQLDKLHRVLTATRDRLQELGPVPADKDAAKKHYDSAHALRTREQEEILAILTAQQAKGWVALRGERFDFSTVGPLVVPAPELQGGESQAAWVNSKPLTLAGLRGQVVVVHFWTFGCINCIHNYGWYKAWQRDFAPKGVTIVGIHTPETKGEYDVAKLKDKAKENGLVYPILVDNKKLNWEAWGNNVWPSVYLVDRQGRVRYWWYGELKWGNRDGEKLMRERIQELLAEKPEAARTEVTSK